MQHRLHLNSQPGYEKFEALLLPFAEGWDHGSASPLPCFTLYWRVTQHFVHAGQMLYQVGYISAHKFLFSKPGFP